MNRKYLTFFLAAILGLWSCEQEEKKNVKWNFKNFDKLTYDYHQVMENQTSLGFGDPILSEAKGTLIISVKESGKADIIFKEVKMSMFSISEEGDTNRTMSQVSPDFFMQDMDEFGNIDGPLNQRTELLAQILFPVPTEEIGIGEKSKLPAVMPFNMFGSIINVNGYNEIKLEAIDDGMARISTVLDIAEYDIPEDADVNYDCYVKGTSNYSFNLSEGYFKTADLDFTMVARNIPDEDKTENNSDSTNFLQDMTKDFGMKMKTDIKLTLREVQ